jgi:hypothetical protein
LFASLDGISGVDALKAAKRSRRGRCRQLGFRFWCVAMKLWSVPSRM